MGGGYIWEDVYVEAAKHNVIAVGGSDRVRPFCISREP